MAIYLNTTRPFENFKELFSNVITISFNEICDDMQTYQDYINNMIT